MNVVAGLRWSCEPTSGGHLGVHYQLSWGGQSRAEVVWAMRLPYAATTMARIVTELNAEYSLFDMGPWSACEWGDAHRFLISRDGIEWGSVTWLPGLTVAQRGMAIARILVALNRELPADGARPTPLEQAVARDGRQWVDLGNGMLLDRPTLVEVTDIVHTAATMIVDLAAWVDSLPGDVRKVLEHALTSERQ